MAIIEMLNTDAETFPEGAFCYTPKEAKRAYGIEAPKHLTHFLTGEVVLRADGTPRWTNVLVIAETHKGLCIRDYEHNGYDDSDFYMIVWDEEKQEPKEVCFASTRGWSYPCYGSKADATPEVMAKYEAWEARRQAAVRAARAEAEARLAAELGLDVEGLKRLRRAYPKGEDFDRVAALLRVKKFHSEFRAKLAQQVRSWLLQQDPRFATPLSLKQLRYV